ncbi:MAG: methionyl-tRNA formyltransferase [bacterium]|nr:methionyl-tRNA formyltransferase [bacterium]
MNVVFFGTPAFVVPVLETLTNQFDVVGVVTAPDVPTGRKKILTPSPVKSFYQRYLERHKKQGAIMSDQAFTKKTVTQLSIIRPDLFIVAAYGHLIPEDVLKIPTFGSLNIHPSLLPKYRGPSPIQTAILNGDEETGITIIQMDEKLDHGPIVAQEKVLLGNNDTFETLHFALFQKAAQMLPPATQRYTKQTTDLLPQNDSLASYCKKITKEDGFFDLNNPPSSLILDRMVRAFFPWPTAWTKLVTRSGQWKILKFLPEKKLQIEGGKPMTMKDFLNGYPEMREAIAELL